MYVSMYLPKINKNICPYKELYTNGHDIFMSFFFFLVITVNWKQHKYPIIEEWILNCRYSYNEIQFINNRKKITDTYNRKYKSQNNYSEQKNPNFFFKAHAILFYLYKTQENAN